MVPGVKFSMTTSTFSTRRRKSSLPSGLRRSSEGALLAAVDGEEVGAFAVDVGAGGAGDVAVGGALDLDDFGAEVAEDHGGVGPGEDPGEVEDADAFEGAGGRRGVALVTGAPLGSCRYQITE